MLLVAALLLGGCWGTDHDSGVAPFCTDSAGKTFAGCREFRGRLQLPAGSKLLAEVKVLQLAGLAWSNPAGKPATADGGAGSAAPASKAAWHFFGGEPLSAPMGAGNEGTVPFVVVLPCELSVTLLLQVPRDGSGALPGRMVSALSFATDGSSSAKGTLVPLQAKNACGMKSNAWDLGVVTVEQATKGSILDATVTLGTGKSRNPLALFDTDGDGTNDLGDTDDDDDGKSDYLDTDAEGDGIADAAQSLSVLPDKDKDGTPDMFQ